MKIRIVTTIVQEVDVQLKDFDLLESMCDKTNKLAKEWANEVFEHPAVLTFTSQ